MIKFSGLEVLQIVQCVESIISKAVENVFMRGEKPMTVHVP